MELDYDTYFSLFGDRVQEMLDAENDPESTLDQMFEALDDGDLADVEMPSIDQVGSKLIYGNLGLSSYFALLALPGRLPKRLRKNDPTAARVLEETSLESWWTNLLIKPYDLDR